MSAVRDLKSTMAHSALRVSGAWLPAVLSLAAFFALPFTRPGRRFLNFGDQAYGVQLGEPFVWAVAAAALLVLLLSFLPLKITVRGDLVTLAGLAGFLSGTGWLIWTAAPFGLGAILSLTGLVLVMGSGLSEAGRIQGDSFTASSILLVSVFVVLFIIYPLFMVLKEAFVVKGVVTFEQFQKTLKHPLFLMLDNPR